MTTNMFGQEEPEGFQEKSRKAQDAIMEAIYLLGNQDDQLPAAVLAGATSALAQMIISSKPDSMSAVEAAKRHIQVTIYYMCQIVPAFADELDKEGLLPDEIKILRNVQ